MSSIETIRDLDDQVFEEFKSYFDKIAQSNFSKNFPTTLHLSNFFTISTNFIKNSIFDCAQNDDLFGTKILFRSQIEHYLRFKFVWFNWINNKSDVEAKRYLDFTNAKEILDSIKAEVDAHKLANPNFKIDSWNKFLNQIPSCKGLSKKEIEEEVQRYTYKSIIRFLKQIDNKTHETTFFSSLVIEYSKLSSFVHGGRGCHNELVKFNDEFDRHQEYLRICGLSFQMAGTVKLFSLLMLVQTDKHHFEKSYLIIDQIIKRV